VPGVGDDVRCVAQASQQGSQVLGLDRAPTAAEQVVDLLQPSSLLLPGQLDHKRPRIHQPPEDDFPLSRLSFRQELRQRKQFVSRERIAARGVVGSSYYVERNRDCGRAPDFVASIEGTEYVVQVAIETRQDVLDRSLY
jgi:hypothetical protein